MDVLHTETEVVVDLEERPIRDYRMVLPVRSMQRYLGHTVHTFVMST